MFLHKHTSDAYEISNSKWSILYVWSMNMTMRDTWIGNRNQFGKAIKVKVIVLNHWMNCAHWFEHKHNNNDRCLNWKTYKFDWNSVQFNFRCDTIKF